MSQNLIDIAKDFVVQISRLDPNSRLADLLHEDASLVTPGSTFAANIYSRKEIIDYFNTQVFPKFNKVAFTPDNLYVDIEQSVVTVEWVSELEPKGKDAYANTGVWILKIKDGLVCEIREYFDTEKVVKHFN